MRRGPRQPPFPHALPSSPAPTRGRRHAIKRRRALFAPRRAGRPGRAPLSGHPRLRGRHRWRYVAWLPFQREHGAPQRNHGRLRSLQSARRGNESTTRGPSQPAAPPRRPSPPGRTTAAGGRGGPGQSWRRKGDGSVLPSPGGTWGGLSAPGEGDARPAAPGTPSQRVHGGTRAPGRQGRMEALKQG